MSSKLKELQSMLRREVDEAVADGVLDASERETIYERLQEIMTTVWGDKEMDEKERDVIWDLYETCLVKLQNIPKE